MFQSLVVLTLATLEYNEKEMHDEVGMHRKMIYLLTEMQELFFATQCWVSVSVKRKLLLLAQEELLEGD